MATSPATPTDQYHLTHTIVHGTVPGCRGCGQPRQSWADDIAIWTGRSRIKTTRSAQAREGWQSVVVAASKDHPLVYDDDDNDGTQCKDKMVLQSPKEHTEMNYNMEKLPLHLHPHTNPIGHQWLAQQVWGSP